MIDNYVYAFKLILAFIAIYGVVNKRHLSYIVFFIIALFMTGVEMISPHETPWAYLFSAGATIKDYEQAFWGGIVLSGGLIMTFIWSAPHMMKIMDSGTESSKT